MTRRLPDVIPLFPLPNVVHFPRVLLPLHVFEPRYRALVRDALRGPRLVGMVLLRGNWQADYFGVPPIFARGTAGQIERSDELPDGRFNIVLRGVREFRAVRELSRQAYREAVVEWAAPPAAPPAPETRARAWSLVRDYVRRRGGDADASAALGPAVDDELFLNFVAQHLDVPPIERQALLEAETLEERGRRLIDVLEFALETLRAGSPGSARPH